MEFLEKREKLKEVLKVAQTDVYSYSSDLEKYSSFPKNKMLKILVEILATLEGVEFKFVCDSEEFFICQSVFYDDKKGKVRFFVDDLQRIGKLIKLNERYFGYNSIEFYKLSADGDLVVEPSFPGYEYLTEFINGVVSYRFENKVEKISDGELERLKNQFLLKKLGEKRDSLINLIDGVSKKLNSSENSVN